MAALLGQVHLPARLLGSGRGTAGPPCAGGLQSHQPHPPVPQRLARLVCTYKLKFVFIEKALPQIPSSLIFVAVIFNSRPILFYI